VIAGPAPDDWVEQCYQVASFRCLFDLMIPRTLSRSDLVFFLDGLINNLPLYLRTFCPRKSTPSSMCVTLVFSWENSRPLALKKSTHAPSCRTLWTGASGRATLHWMNGEHRLARSGSPPCSTAFSPPVTCPLPDTIFPLPDWVASEG
jgi:hypothetical protein